MTESKDVKIEIAKDLINRRAKVVKELELINQELACFGDNNIDNPKLMAYLVDELYKSLSKCELECKETEDSYRQFKDGVEK